MVVGTFGSDVVNITGTSISVVSEILWVSN